MTAKVIGRNEIRVAKNGQVALKGGTLSSVRWIEVEQGAKLSGFGNIDGSLYCHGQLVLNGQSPLNVTGEAILGGELSVSSITKDMVVLKATKLKGRFQNSEVLVDGKKYKINYNATSVFLSK